MSAPPKIEQISFSLHPKQSEAFMTLANELLYGGATRGGKSYFTRAALIVWSTLIPGLQSFIFRKFYDDVISNHMEGPDGFRALLADSVKRGVIKITENQVRWTTTGSLITLSHCASDEAVEKAQGVPKHVLFLEEAPQMLERHIRFLRSWVSMPEEMRNKLPEQLKTIYPNMTPEQIKNLFPKIIYTGNPTGISMNYFRRNFVKPAPKGTIFRAPLKEGGFLRQYIEAKVEDNPSEDAALVRARVAGIGDDSMTDALLNANWDAPVGDFFPQYDEERHCIPSFGSQGPPAHWFKFMSFDWGSAEPFGVIWWAVSDGVPFQGTLGETRWYRKGALIAYREWYGCNPDDPAKGLQLRNEQIARGIIERTREKTSGMIVTDSYPFSDRGMSKNGRKYTIADVFADAGCPLIQGNTARVHGWSQVRDRLIGIRSAPDLPPDPMLLFCDCCVFTRDYLPALGRSKTNPEDAEDEGEATHMSDCVRLGCATKPIVTTEKKEDSGEYKRPGAVTPKEILRKLRQQAPTTYGRRV